MKRTTFKQFLEGAPDRDKNFVAMMNNILADIPELKQQQTDFQKKISDIADSIPALLQKQRDLEAWMSAAVKAVQAIPNTMLAPYLHELGDLLDEYQKGTSVLDILTFTMPHDFEHEHWKRDKDSKQFTTQQINNHSGNLDRKIHNPNEDEKHIPLVVNFIKKHADDLEDCIRAVDHGYDAIRDMANKEKWPAPWTRYGALPSDRHAFARTQEALIYWIKELR